MSEHHKEMRTIMRAYAAIQLALVLYIVKSPDDVTGWCVPIVLSLFCISIPASIAYAGLARISKEDEQRNPNPLSTISQILSFVPSLLAFSIIIASASKLAGFIFVVSSVVWVYLIVRLRRSQQ
ncbi:hypothetical protein [Saccharophagus degradans]|uniref:hypothetical protein n=1 Tax=Saccharophagus degradans TaxID=86304 RepID=UPI00059D233D|nr:hypothetical protein [Saccharophagus degradans]